MSSKGKDDLLKKYLMANSSLEEEEVIFNAKNLPPEIKEWVKYVKGKKKKVPNHLNDSIWAAIQERKKRKQRFLLRWSAVAASVAIFASVFIGLKERKYAQKEALLNEALSMYTEEEQTSSKQTIIYEDEMFIIYLASK